MASKTFAFEEVAKHNHKNDCWLIIDGKVYDVTPFLEEHPGGDEVLLQAAEKDATDDFEDVGHSDTAREMMEKYLVGNIDTNTLPEKPKHRSPPPAAAAAAAAAAASNQSTGSALKMLQYLIPLLILGFAFVLQYYGNKASAAKPEH